jgi:hypothetical protein
VLLVNRRSDHDFPADIADDAPGQHVGVAGGIVVTDGEHGVAHSEHRDLLPIDQRRGAALGQDILERANVVPGCRKGQRDSGVQTVSSSSARSAGRAGRGCPRSSTKTT